MQFWIAQAIGVVALSMVVLSFQQRTQKLIMFFQLFSTALFVLHFALLGTWTGCILNSVAFFRSLVYFNKDKRWGASLLWPAAFTAISLIAGVLTWESPLSLLPAVAMMLSSITTWQNKAHIVRILNFPGSIMWMIYDFLCGSYPGAVTEIISSASVVVAIVRLDIGREKKKLGDDDKQ